MKALGQLEQAIMDVLWTSPCACSVREVTDALSERDLAYTTVMTVLDRLARKRLVIRHKDGRAWRYAPAATRDAYVSELMMTALDLSGDRDAALTHFARSMSEPEAQVLRAALRRPHTASLHTTSQDTTSQP